MKATRCGAFFGAALAVVSLAPSAAADPASARRADKLFKEAADAITQKRYAEACPKLEESNRLERAVGTEYNLAVCYELSHRPASARRMYGKAAALASQSNKESTAKEARERAKKLDTVVPRIVLKTQTDPAAFKVRCDDQDIDVEATRRPIEVDPGPHHFVATAEGFAPFERNVPLDAGETKEINMVLDALPSAHAPAAPPPKTTAPDAAKEQATVPWRWVGLGAAAVGVIGVGVGGVFALGASSAKDDSGCRDGQFCPDEASAERLRGAKSDANLATVFVVGGSVLAVAGVVLFVVAPSPSRPAVTVSASAGTQLTGLRVLGSW